MFMYEEMVIPDTEVGLVKVKMTTEAEATASAQRTQCKSQGVVTVLLILGGLLWSNLLFQM